ncbi:carbon-nitrogen hydrolase family protein [Alteromonas sp. 5E99-2]|uniref:carbon-nitrogen hydrolase family protein n=1 Tax=Alteromonas sp. 5E99-2 TaxID=2817683 RepID=UPI001A99CF14|nr:carbon-nitrogen hydrolase family protein [Alteromonas sp. 5E99-2]MBO1255049.1 carbon-nitrogen hydrolase family protein [Alteromonas sp. 5E99-2]
MTTLKVALGQIAPVWLNREKTIDKILDAANTAVSKHADLITFGEGLLPGYPFWIERTNGAKFNSSVQKSLHSLYVQQAVNIENGDLDRICNFAKSKQIAFVLGLIEKPDDRGGHSVYCSVVYIDKSGIIQSVHRKLQPTYEERLTWSPGDGHGLRTHKLGDFTLGALNCWENWMPLVRSAMYAQGENLRVAVWPGGEQNTLDITRFIAKEGRSYVMSVSGLMRPGDFPKETPHLDLILDSTNGNQEFLANGASCIAAPDGTWLIEPQVGVEGVFTAEIALSNVFEERQNFDPVGHYSRPDVTQLTVNRKRQSTININDEQ